MPDQNTAPATISYSSLGFVDAPFAPAASEGESHWVRLVGNAAANALLTAAIRARSRSVPVLVTMSEEIPDYYYRVAQNNLLARTASEPSLNLMALNIPLEMMRLGRIRGTLAELAELVVAVDMPTTLGAWYGIALQDADSALPEAALVTADELAETHALFLSDPRAAVTRFFGIDAKPLSDSEMDVVVHEAYLRQVGQPVEVASDEEAAEVVPFDPMGTGGVEPLQPAHEAEIESVVTPDQNMREYLLALAGSRLSPILARAFGAYGQYGEALAAQELKITKAPRKTLAALLRFMSARWGSIVVIYDSFDSWPMLDQKARMDVLASLTELRYIIAETGVMVVGVLDGVAPEIVEQFAAAEQVDWSLPEVHALSRGDRSFNVDWVQSWLDDASLGGTSALRADGPELAPLAAACGGDITRFASMADAALRDAALRGLAAPDEAALAIGLAAGQDEAGV